MSSRDTVICHSVEIEKILEKLGAEGTGLGQKSINLQHLFSSEINQKLKSICYVRNQAAHEVDFQCNRLDLFISNCDEVKEVLNSLDIQRMGDPRSQNMSYYSTYTSDFTAFSIPSNLREFSGIRFIARTGQVVRCEDKSYTNRSGEKAVTTRTQKIWLRLSSGNEEYLEFTDFAVNELRSGHRITIIYAKTDDRDFFVTLWIDQIKKYFYHNVNIYSLAAYVCYAKSKSQKLRGKEFDSFSILISLLRNLFNFAWKSFCVLIGTMIFSIVISSIFNAHSGSVFLIAFTAFYLLKAIVWLSKLCRSSIKHSSKVDVYRKQIFNHIDRIFGHQLIEY